MPILKNLVQEDYNLLNIKHTKERPYFFGLGMPSRYNCNYGFGKKSSKAGLGKEESTLCLNSHGFPT